MPKPILLIGEARGESEVRFNSTFVGSTGAELIRMLAEAGVLSLSKLDREALHLWYTRADSMALEGIWSTHRNIVRRTNVFNIHPPRNDLEFFTGPKATGLPGYPALTGAKYVQAIYEPELDRLRDEITSLDPDLIIALGNTALWALAGRTGITKLRGTTFLSTHTVLDYKVLSTYHPSAVCRQWNLRPTAIADFMKAKGEASFAELRRPHREIYIEPTIPDITAFIEQHIVGCELLSVDIETSGSRITCIGFAPSPSLAIVIPFDDERKPSGSYWNSLADERHVWGLVRQVLTDASVPKLYQNGVYDIAFCWRSYHIPTFGAAEDTMLLSHALHPESLKGLGYLGSIYTDEGAWKHMRKKNETIKRDN